MNETGEETPGRRAIEVMKTVHKDLVFKKPIGTVRKKKKQKVLDDDTYVDVRLN